MKQEDELIETRNEEGKRIIKEVTNSYSIKILKEIKQNPSILPYLLERMELIEEEFEECLFGDEQANITVYYEMISIINSLTKSKVKY